MSFNSLPFLVFLPIVFCLYWFIFGKNLKRQNLFLVAASYVFYGWWNWRFLILIAVTTLCSWGSGLLIEKYRPGRKSAKCICTLNIILNLGILALFKYYDFFAQSFADLFLHGASDGLLLHLVLPIGISFYTFQALGYTIDVYRGTIRPTHDLIRFAAFVSFFPQLVAGPIERASTLLSQFSRPRQFDAGQAVDGLRQMLWGFFKKIVVADACAIYVNDVFGNTADYSGVQLIVAAFFFAFQVYGDFSGYSDIAAGTAKLFGIQLTQNFRTPFFSRNIAEFWRRWHITLNGWFRDYVYIPLGGNRCPKARVVLNTFIVFLLSGLWHGAQWTAVAWGAYSALLFIPHILTGSGRKYRDTVAQDRILPTLKEAGQMFLTTLLAVLGMMIFRSETLSQAWDIFVRMGQWTPGCGLGFLLSPVVLNVTVRIVPMLLIEWADRREEHALSMGGVRCRAIRYAVYLGLLFLVALFFDNGSPDFIYFRF